MAQAGTPTPITHSPAAVAEVKVSKLSRVLIRNVLRLQRRGWEAGSERGSHEMPARRQQAPAGALRAAPAPARAPCSRCQPAAPSPTSAHLRA